MDEGSFNADTKIIHLGRQAANSKSPPGSRRLVRSEKAADTEKREEGRSSYTDAAPFVEELTATVSGVGAKGEFRGISQGKQHRGVHFPSERSPRRRLASVSHLGAAKFLLCHAIGKCRTCVATTAAWSATAVGEWPFEKGEKQQHCVRR
uniref:Uncharacterized protein n=1 Tax=Neobodo designis TaxID=312471 RepID=A0A7S1R0N6_NEODS